MLTAALVVSFAVMVAYVAVFNRYTGVIVSFWSLPWTAHNLVRYYQFNPLLWDRVVTANARFLFRTRFVQTLMIGSLIIWYSEPEWRYLLATIYTATPLFWQLMNQERRPHWTVGHFLAGILSMFVFWLTASLFMFGIRPIVYEQPTAWLVIIGFSYLTLLVMVFDDWMRTAAGWVREDIPKALKATVGYF